MLVLTRKAEQSIMIGDDIEVFVSSIDGNTVRIGIKAPRDIKILRRETFEQVRLENLRAVQAAAKYTGDFKQVFPRGPENTESSEKKAGDSEKTSE